MSRLGLGLGENFFSRVASLVEKVRFGRRLCPPRRAVLLHLPSLQGFGSLDSSLAGGVSQMARFVCATVGCLFLNLLRCKCRTRLLRPVALWSTECARQLRFRSSKRAHHLDSAAQCLRSVCFFRRTVDLVSFGPYRVGWMLARSKASTHVCHATAHGACVFCAVAARTLLRKFKFAPL